ncbi:hypothetical protein V5F44_00905 [Xanthobacter sp. V2C-8]|uniref:hypothetical protein n=1 Tax=Xanthobacter albus TaxID=3119929 RepID=UPI00372BE364
MPLLPVAGMLAVAVPVPHGSPVSAFRPLALVPTAHGAAGRCPMAAMTAAMLLLPVAGMLAAAVETGPVPVRAMVSAMAFATTVALCS